MLPVWLAQAIETEEERSKMEQLYDEYERLLYSIAFRYMHDSFRAEDAVHDLARALLGPHHEDQFLLEQGKIQPGIWTVGIRLSVLSERMSFAGADQQLFCCQGVIVNQGVWRTGHAVESDVNLTGEKATVIFF